MSLLSPENVVSVRPMFRVLAGLIFLLSLLSILLALFVLVTEEREWGVIALLIVPAVTGWMSFKVFKTGYPPKFLLFASTKK